MKGQFMQMFLSILAVYFLCVNTSALASEKTSTTVPTPEKQTQSTETVQPQINEQNEKKTAEQRKKIMEEAYAAIAESRKALKALDEKNKEEALKALELAIGKMELIVARDPELAFAKVAVNQKLFDLYASVDTLKKVIKQAKEYLDGGEIQSARPLIAGLASEIVIESVNIPLATYPVAVKAVVPLIDKGEFDKAKEALQAALNTLVIIKEEVIPLPVDRAKELLKEAETLAEKKDRSEDDNKKLAELLNDIENQLKVAELLGYGKEKAFKPIYEQLNTIREKTKENKSGKGFFDKIKNLISKMFD